MLEGYPKKRKQAFKPGIHKKGTNYRGYFLLHPAYAIYEAILNAKLQPTAENIQNDERRGLRNGRSCKDTVCAVELVAEGRRDCSTPLFLASHMSLADWQNIRSIGVLSGNRTWNPLTPNRGQILVL